MTQLTASLAVPWLAPTSVSILTCVIAEPAEPSRLPPSEPRHRTGWEREPGGPGKGEGSEEGVAAGPFRCLGAQLATGPSAIVCSRFKDPGHSSRARPSGWTAPPRC